MALSVAVVRVGSLIRALQPVRFRDFLSELPQDIDLRESPPELLGIDLPTERLEEVSQEWKQTARGRVRSRPHGWR